MNDLSTGNSLPLLNSERKEMLEHIKQAKIEAEASWYGAIRSCIETVNRSDDLSEEQKTKLIKEFYNK